MGVIAAAAGGAAMAVPGYQRGGWVALVPTTALIYAMPAEDWDPAVRSACWNELESRPMWKWQYRRYANRCIDAIAHAGDRMIVTKATGTLVRFRDASGRFVSPAVLARSLSLPWDGFPESDSIRDCGIDIVQAVGTLTKTLDDPDQGRSTSAALALFWFREDAAPAVTTLIEWLAAPDYRATFAPSVLAGIGPAAIEPLAAVIQDPSSPGRKGAVEALGSMDQLPPSVVPLLIECLADESAEVRLSAAIGLAGREVEVARVVQVLTDDANRPAKSRGRAVHGLKKVGPGAIAAMPKLKEWFGSEKESAMFLDMEQISIGLTMLEIDPADRTPLPMLLADCIDPPQWVPKGVLPASLLKRFGISADQHRTRLLDLLVDPEPDIRRRAMDAVVGLGGVIARDLVGAVRNSSDPVMRFRALMALSKISPDDEQTARDAHDARIGALHDPDPAVRLAAACSLGTLAPGAPTNDQLFEWGLQTSIPEARDLVFAVRPLEDGESLTARLSAALDDPRPEIRSAAMAVLNDPGSVYDPPLDVLRRALHDPDESIRFAAANLIVERDPEAVVAPVIGLLGSPDADARRQAALLLWRAGPAAHPAVPALRLAADDPVEPVATAASLALRDLDPNERDEDVRALVALLSDEDAATRQAAAEALGGMGPAAVAAVEELESMAGDEDANVRIAAEAAVRAIIQPEPASESTSEPGTR